MKRLASLLWWIADTTVKFAIVLLFTWLFFRTLEMTDPIPLAEATTRELSAAVAFPIFVFMLFYRTFYKD